MTPDEIRLAAQAAVERSRREQGLPPKVTASATLAKVAALLARP